MITTSGYAYLYLNTPTILSEQAELKGTSSPHVLRDGSRQMSPPRPLQLTWFLRPIRFGPGGFMGDLMLWGLPPFSATFPTLITADIMVLTEDRSEPSKPMGELDVIGTRV